MQIINVINVHTIRIEKNRLHRRRVEDLINLRDNGIRDYNHLPPLVLRSRVEKKEDNEQEERERGEEKRVRKRNEGWQRHGQPKEDTKVAETNRD